MLVAQHRDMLAETIENQERDPKWSEWAENQLSQTLRNSTTEVTQVTSLRCGSSLCQIQYKWDNIEQRDQSIDKLGSIASWEHHGFLLVDPESPLAATAYVSRNGSPPPIGSHGDDNALDGGNNG